jgi:hypothetical protein
VFGKLHKPKKIIPQVAVNGSFADSRLAIRKVDVVFALCNMQVV